VIKKSCQKKEAYDLYKILPKSASFLDQRQLLSVLKAPFLHQISLERIVAPDKKSICLTPQLIFRQKNSLVVVAFTWTPVFIQKDLVKKWKKIFYKPIDRDLKQRKP